MLVEFEHGDRNTQVAVLVSSLVFFAASITQVMMLAWGYYKGGKLIHHWAVYDKNNENNQKQYSYISGKVATLPIWSLIGIFSHYSKGDVPSIITVACIAGTFLTFIFLKFYYMNHLGKAAIFSLNQSTSPMSADDMEMRNKMKTEIDDGKILKEHEIKKLDRNYKKLERESVEEEKTREEIGV